MKDFKDAKVEMLQLVAEVKEDIATLNENIRVMEQALEQLGENPTEEQLKVFCNGAGDIEQGLKHIELF